ncbi:MAG: hypothetical protein M1820_002796 [Bogoriella megaspora]|nr:MAG: hypothetical protein M1820_002796 [Bogoriella megaspora]
MAENAPPGTNAPTSASGDASTRGMPYYEKLRNSLRGTLARKRQLDQQVEDLNAQILSLETQYLEETSSAGNIIRGFDNYMKAAPGNPSTATNASLNSSLGAGTSTRRRTQISDADRIFSRSSAAWINADPSAVSPPQSSGSLGPSVNGSGTGNGGAESGGNSTPRTGGAVTPSGTSFGGRETPKSEAGKAATRAGGNKDKKKGVGEKEKEKEEEEEGRPMKRGKITYGRDG